jgi:hypothetical protein
MVGLGRWRQFCMGTACLAVLALGGCGTTGSAGISETAPPPTSNPSVQGVVLAPDGMFAAAGWRWMERLSFASRAFALLQDIMPVQSGVSVSLSRVDAQAFARGTTDCTGGNVNCPQLLAEGSTDDTGLFQIAHPSIAHLEDDCRLIVQVGSGDTLTRAFVLTRSNNNIDAATEATVRLMLLVVNHTCTQFCSDVTVAELKQISEEVRAAATNANGSDVAQINQSAYDLVLANVGRNGRVKVAVNAALPAECQFQ